MSDKRSWSWFVEIRIILYDKDRPNPKIGIGTGVEATSYPKSNFSRYERNIWRCAPNATLTKFGESETNTMNHDQLQ